VDFSNVLAWLSGIVSAIIGGYVTYWFTRKADKEKAELAARDKQRSDDSAGYELLIRDWYKLLDIQPAYPALGLETSEADLPFPAGSAEASRRNVAYDLLFNIFARAYMLKDAFEKPGRLGTVDKWEAWDNWANEYFKRQSIRDHFVLWRDKYCSPGVDQWLESKATDRGNPMVTKQIQNF
jgi:hypothetical protein